MALDFPSSPTDGQVYSGFVYKTADGAWSKAPTGVVKAALPKNYIVNPCFQHSQQNARTTGTATNYYAADQWVGLANNAGAPGWQPRFISNAVVTSNGSQYMLSSNPQFGGGDLASNYLCITQNIEGRRIADLQYGTANAKWSVLSLLVRNAVSRDYTYAVTLRNGANNRSISWPLPIPAYPGSAFYPFVFSVPPDTTGTWPVDSSVAMNISFTTYCNANLRAPTAGVWTAGNYLGVTGMVNDIGVTPGTFLFGDVGLYADPDHTGVAPAFEIPDYADELRRCRRYWYRAYGLNGGVTSATTVGRGGMRHPVPMRTTPAGTIRGSPRVYDFAVTPIITSLVSVCNLYAAEFDITCSAGGMTVGRAASNYFQTVDDYIEMNARM